LAGPQQARFLRSSNTITISLSAPDGRKVSTMSPNTRHHVPGLHTPRREPLATREVIPPGLASPRPFAPNRRMTRRRKEEDRERLAAALRANLARRKAQARQRQDEEPQQRQGTRSRPTIPEPGGSAEPGGAGEGSHDSAEFVGDKPSG
jgi:hypothetical protein